MKVWRVKMSREISINRTYKRMSDESESDYIWRICSNKESKKYDLTWEEVGEILNHELDEEYTSSKWRKNFQNEKRGYDRAIEKNIDFESEKETLESLKREVYIETQKKRDILSQYRQLQREQSRSEELLYKIEKAFERKLSMGNLILPKKRILKQNSGKKILVAFGDSHYGADFCIKGFFDEILNEYNPEVFKKRMFQLRDEIYEFSDMTGCNEVAIVDLGDSIDGKLHISQLASLKTDVVDDIVDYAEFIVSWLMSMQDDFNIDFYTSTGNHSDLRLITGKKGDFPHENIEKIYHKWVRKNFEDNSSINVYDNLNGINYFDICGHKVLTVHGQDDKNIAGAIDSYENTYNIDIEYIIFGHLHTKKENEVAKGKQTIQVRSVVGMNDFSQRIKKTSDAGALIALFVEGKGRKITNDVVFEA
jgi:hypothetical protein